MNGNTSTLRKSDEGLLCEEYELFGRAEAEAVKLSPRVRELMGNHENACQYHQHPSVIESILQIRATSEDLKTARQLLQKYN